VSGPVLLYLQQAGVDQNVRRSGTQQIPQDELAFYIQEAGSRIPLDAQLRPALGSADRAGSDHPPSTVFFAPFIGQTVVNGTGSYTFRQTARSVGQEDVAAAARDRLRSARRRAAGVPRECGRVLRSNSRPEPGVDPQH